MTEEVRSIKDKAEGQSNYYGPRGNEGGREAEASQSSDSWSPHDQTGAGCSMGPINRTQLCLLKTATLNLRQPPPLSKAEFLLAFGDGA